MKGSFLAIVIFASLFSLHGMEIDQNSIKTGSIISQMVAQARDDLTGKQKEIIQRYLDGCMSSKRISSQDRELFEGIVSVLSRLSYDYQGLTPIDTLEIQEMVERDKKIIEHVCSLLKLRMDHKKVEKLKLVNSEAIFFCSLMRKQKLTIDERHIYACRIHAQGEGWPRKYESLNALKFILSHVKYGPLSHDEQKHFVRGIYENFVLLYKQFSKDSKFRNKVKLIAQDNFWSTHKTEFTQIEHKKLAKMRSNKVTHLPAALIGGYYALYIKQPKEQVIEFIIRIFLKTNACIAVNGEEWLLMANVLFDEGRLVSFKNHTYQRQYVMLALIFACAKKDAEKMLHLLNLPQSEQTEEDVEHNREVINDLFKWSLKQNNDYLMWELFKYIHASKVLSGYRLKQFYEKHKKDLPQSVQRKCEKFIEQLEE